MVSNPKSTQLKVHNQVFSSPDFISRAISSAFIISVDPWVWFQALHWMEGSHKGCQWLTLGSWQCPNQGQSYPCKSPEGSQQKNPSISAYVQTSWQGGQFSLVANWGTLTLYPWKSDLDTQHKILSVTPSPLSTRSHCSGVVFVQEGSPTGLWNAILCSQGNLHKCRECPDLQVSTCCFER